jgi:ABC-type siderophore export system fused ATPase/permease subunit
MVMNNQKLRQQLEEAQSTNARLMEDVQHLTEGWNESREKLQKREAVWQESFEHESGRSQKLRHFSLSLVRKDALVIKNEMGNIQQNVQRYVAIINIIIPVLLNGMMSAFCDAVVVFSIGS